MELDYLAKAAQADEYAEQATDIVEKRFWQKVAQNYRRLAVFVEPGSRGFAWKKRVELEQRSPTKR